MRRTHTRLPDEQIAHQVLAQVGAACLLDVQKHKHVFFVQIDAIVVANHVLRIFIDHRWDIGVNGAINVFNSIAEVILFVDACPHVANGRRAQVAEQKDKNEGGECADEEANFQSSKHHLQPRIAETWAQSLLVTSIFELVCKRAKQRQD